MKEIHPDKTVFATVVRNPTDWPAARLMIESLRTFGGALGQRTVWVFDSSPHPAPLPEKDVEEVEVIPLGAPDTAKGYLFAEKVFACAQAEARAQGRARSLVCIDPGVLVVNPPVLFDLGKDFDAAVRPVHIKNVGLEVGEPLDEFWRKIYATVGVEDVQETVETFVGQQRVRAYFNSHAFAVNPDLGLLQQWAELFQALVGDQAFQAAACQDERHQIFLFQALWSALLVSRLEWPRIRILPPGYNYPYNLQSKVPPERRARVLNDLVCIAYEERSLSPNRMEDMRVDEPLRSWLAVRYVGN
jgi:hypothetical protein